MPKIPTVKLTKQKLSEIISSDASDESKVNQIWSLVSPKEKVDFDFEKFRLWFNETTGKNIRVINPKAKGQIRARLRDGYTKADIAKAVKNCFRDKFHIENPQYLTPEFISRADKLEKYLFADVKQVVLPKDWYQRDLTQAQIELLTAEQEEQWRRNKVAVEMGGGRLKNVIR